MNGTLLELHPALNLGPSEGLKTLKKKKITRLFLIFQPTMDYEHVDLRGEETVEHGNSGSRNKLSTEGLEALYFGK